MAVARSSEPDVATCAPWQSWALLEEDVGAIQRAEELRSFRRQRRTEVVLPRTFADPDVVLAPVFTQIAAWFKHSEVRDVLGDLTCMPWFQHGASADACTRCAGQLAISAQCAALGLRIPCQGE